MIVNFKVPFDIFSHWFEKAKKKSEIVEPNAMCLSTVNAEGKPSSRMVLLKKFDESGFCFFTNFMSRKSRELSSNNHAALCFYWPHLGLQVRIEGTVEKVSNKEADDYFASRDRGSKIGAWASKQSCTMENREEFEERIAKITADFQDQDVPRPPFWSGFRLSPNLIEFWQEGDFRLHHRDLYVRVASGWQLSKLYP